MLRVVACLVILFHTATACAAGGVVDGQRVNAATTNAAFLTKNGDDTTTHKIGLNDADVASGGSVTNIQRELNAHASVMGLSTNQVYNYKFTWGSDIVGSAMDSIKARIEALVSKFSNASGHTHSGVDGQGPKISGADLGSTVPTTLGGTGQDLSASTGLIKVSSGTVSASTLVNADVSTSAAIARSKLASGTADHVVINDGSGVMSSEAQLASTRGGTGVSNAGTLTYGSNNITLTTSGATSLTLPTSGTLVTTAATQQLTNKDIDGGTASNTSRITIPKDTLSNLNSLTRKAGTIVYATDQAKPYFDDGASLTAISAGASSSTDSSTELTNIGLAASVAGNALTIELKSKSGTNPSGSDIVSIGFRSSTATIGTYTQRTVTSSLSIVVSSGSTLGQVSGVAEYIYVYAIDNAGTVELAVSTGRYVDDGSLITTTAEGGAGAADSRTVIYSTTARTSVPVRLIGRIKSTQATAGTWASSPSEISVMPLTYESIKSSDSGAAYHVEVVNFGGGTGSNCSSSPCTINSQSGSWLSSVSRAGTGSYTLNIASGVFSAMPTCICSVDNNSGGTACGMRTNTATATAVEIDSWNGSHASADGLMQVICMGPR